MQSILRVNTFAWDEVLLPSQSIYFSIIPFKKGEREREREMSLYIYLDNTDSRVYV